MGWWHLHRHATYNGTDTGVLGHHHHHFHHHRRVTAMGMVARKIYTPCEFFFGILDYKQHRHFLYGFEQYLLGGSKKKGGACFPLPTKDWIMADTPVLYLASFRGDGRAGLGFLGSRFHSFEWDSVHARL
jgi:hypothetical protein